jgi:glycosyltransferase involved in cell wall biosynthesis
MPEVRFMLLAPGKLLLRLPSDRVVLVGDQRLDISVGASSWRGIGRLLIALPRVWTVAGRIAVLVGDESALLHCHTVLLALIAGLARRRSRGADIRVLLHFHSTMNRRRLGGIVAAAQRFLVGRLTDGVIAVSRSVAEYWQGIRCPVWVVHPGLKPHRRPVQPPDYFAPRQGVRDLLIAASLSKEKGQLVAVEAMMLLGRRTAEFHLWITGGPLNETHNPFVGHLRRKIREYHLEENVTLLGYVEDVGALVPFAWVALQQRITTEPFGLWTLEALSAGVPVIASRTGGTPEIVRDEQEGLLVPPNDPKAVAAAILRLADDPVLYDRFARSARARAEEFSISNFISGISEVYRSVGQAKL